jgi:hypothetical protein
MHLEGYADETGNLIRKLKRDLKCHIADQVVRDAISIAANPL